jgi:hypothetical protein
MHESETKSRIMPWGDSMQIHQSKKVKQMKTKSSTPNK